VTSHTILVVEDDHGLRDTLAKALRSEGFAVVTAVDGARAIRTVAAQTVDAVVLDIGLPDSDGRDVCQALRARGCDATVIFLSARGNVTDRLAGFSSG
jgi:DNA-binding response OmpR family regulator